MSANIVALKPYEKETSESLEDLARRYLATNSTYKSTAEIPEELAAPARLVKPKICTGQLRHNRPRTMHVAVKGHILDRRGERQNAP